MKIIIATYKCVAFLALLLIGFIGWACGLAFIFWSPGLAWQWRSYMFRQWARANATLLGMNLMAQGKVQCKPVMLVSNHLSYLDLILLVTQFDAVFVAKSEIANWPLIGFLSRCMGTIFIERGRKRDILRVNALIESALKKGQSIIVFPEGTTSPGLTVLPFKSPLFEPAVKLGIEVYCASLLYRTSRNAQPAAESVCWWGDMEFVPHLWRLFYLNEFDAFVKFDEMPLPLTNRKQMAREAWTRVARGTQAMHALYATKSEPLDCQGYTPKAIQV